MDEVDRLFGERLRRWRKHRGFTQDSLGAVLGVAEKTVGKWERGEVLPSASNMLALEKLGLIDPWQNWNGAGEARRTLPEEINDRVRQTFGYPVCKLLARIVDVQDESECVMIAYFRRLPSRQQWSVLDIVTSMSPSAKPDN